ncbi:MAG TPA: hypothetical protein PKW75_09440 [candidate division Zixibacteria bacterium]|nr:hypothetical protein [candidate division Zixibacteria bacterium]HPM37640.1 hypothetical protein [candidate division Zixibacteria bacterium]
MQRIVLVLSAVAVSLLPLGCSDDCADCPEHATPAGFVNGTVHVTPQVSLSATINGYGSILPTVDSIRLGDSLLTSPGDYYVAMSAPANPLWRISFYENISGDVMYSPGDVAHIEIWGPGRLAYCDVVVLDPNESAADMISPLPGTETIAPDESAAVIWHRALDAQYYAVQLRFIDFANGVTRESNVTDWTADTAYTVGPTLYPDSLAALIVEITPFTGPNPAVGSNFAGGWLAGRLISFGGPASTMLHGWNEPDKSIKTLPDDLAASQRLSPAEIIDGIYRQAAK